MRLRLPATLAFATVALAACGGAISEGGDGSSSPTPQDILSPATTATPPSCTATIVPGYPSGAADVFTDGAGAAAQTQADGLKITDLTPGTGDPVKAGDCIVVHYTGWLSTGGEPFDSSRKAGSGGGFRLVAGPAGQVIKGWQEGIPGMKLGGRRRLTIPPDLGYGAQANGPIPANATLIFVIEMLKVN